MMFRALQNRLYGSPELLRNVIKNNLEGCMEALRNIEGKHLENALNTQDDDGNNMLHIAVYNKNITLCKLFLHTLSNYVLTTINPRHHDIFNHLPTPGIINVITMPNDNNDTPLTLAIKNNDLPVIEAIFSTLNRWAKDYLIMWNCLSINPTDNLLLEATKANNFEICEFFIKQCNPTNNLRLPLAQSILQQNYKLTKLFTEYIPEESKLEMFSATVDNRNSTLLHYAIYAPVTANLQILELILNAIPKPIRLKAINTKKKNGNTVLMVACKNGSLKSVIVILDSLETTEDKLLALDQKDANNKNLFQIAENYGHTEILAYLKANLYKKNAYADKISKYIRDNKHVSSDQHSVVDPMLQQMVNLTINKDKTHTAVPGHSAGLRRRKIN